jgi:hypothetical protein
MAVVGGRQRGPKARYAAARRAVSQSEAKLAAVVVAPWTLPEAELRDQIGRTAVDAPAAAVARGCGTGGAGRGRAPDGGYRSGAGAGRGGRQRG